MLTDDHWRRFTAAAGIEADPTLATLRARRRERPRVEALVSSAVAGLDYDALAGRLSQRGVGFTEILSTDRVLEAPQAQVPGKCSAFGFSDLAFRSPDLPLPALVRDGHLSDPPPLLGGNTEEILRALRYDADAIAALTRTGAVVAADPEAELWARPPRPVEDPVTGRASPAPGDAAALPGTPASRARPA
jgi:crotonobetainyl-CoA:carnitine CoA-transferase CaiB-like acyl-CoA transferase